MSQNQPIGERVVLRATECGRATGDPRKAGSVEQQFAELDAAFAELETEVSYLEKNLAPILLNVAEANSDTPSSPEPTRCDVGHKLHGEVNIVAAMTSRLASIRRRIDL